jgi:hypothetical protein
MKHGEGIAVRNFPAISAIFRNFRNFPQFFRNFRNFSVIFRNFWGLPQFLPMEIFETAIFRRGSKSQYVV